MKKKILVYTSVMLLSISALFGCSSASKSEENETKSVQTEEKETTKNQTGDTTQTNTTEETQVEGISTLDTITDVILEEYDEEDYTKVLVSDTAKSSDDVTVLKSTKENTIYLNEDSVKSEVSGVKAEGSKITISAPGTYILTGSLNDGQVVVDCAEKGTVQIVLNNVSISNSKNAPIYIKDAKKVLMVLAENTQNELNDATEYTYEDTENEEPSACLFSKEDLVISGNGSLTVNANFNNGIVSKDKLKITNGNITVTSANHAIRGKDCLMICGGSFKLTAGGDGLKAENSNEETLGYVNITGGKFDIEATEDGIQASSIVNITDGEFNIITAGGAVNATSKGGQGMDKWFGNQQTSTTDTVSTKGIKGNAVQISGGNINVDSKDDAIHANGELKVLGGSLSIAAGDDGIHADGTLTIEDGEINITDSYEGIESPEMIFNGGVTYIKADDDGTNAAGGELSSNQSDNMKPGGMMSTSVGTMTINGGYIYMDAAGDGLDANGDLIMNGGTVIVEGPVNDGNTAVDYDGNFEVNKGTLLASGSSGMVEGVSSASQENTAIIYFGTTISAGTNVVVLDSENNVVMAFTPTKTSECMIVASDKLIQGETYIVKTGGSCSGEEKDGLCTEGTYNGGTQIQTFTISSSVTTVGNGGGMGGQGGQMGRPGTQMEGQMEKPGTQMEGQMERPETQMEGQMGQAPERR